MASTHPCDHRKAFAPWKSDHLYVGDSGEILCGRCMGIESTYAPWAWSDLGKMNPDRSVILMFEGRPTTYRCETDRFAARTTH